MPSREWQEYTVVGECIVDKSVAGRMRMETEVRSCSGPALGQTRAVWDVSLVGQSSKPMDVRPNERFVSVENSKTVRATD